MKCSDIEISLANWFDYRRNFVLPNVSYGLHIHECDILAISKSGYATEVEIKVSKADLLKDKEKEHHHRSDKIKAFFFAVPLDMESFALENIPKECGLLCIDEYKRVLVKRKPIPRKDSRKLTEDEIKKLGDLAMMRYWNMRKKEKQ